MKKSDKYKKLTKIDLLLIYIILLNNITNMDATLIQLTGVQVVPVQPIPPSPETPREPVGAPRKGANPNQVTRDDLNGARKKLVFQSTQTTTTQ